MLEIKGLKVIRGDFTVTLPELYIADGQCVALCGVSGSGKSTLLEAIGLLTPALSVERFILDDIEVDELNEQDAQALRISEIGIMPQVGGLLPYLSIRENLELQIKLALKQKIEPIYPQSADDQILPNTTGALQEALAHAKAKNPSLDDRLNSTGKVEEQQQPSIIELDAFIGKPLTYRGKQYVFPYEKLVEAFDKHKMDFDLYGIDGPVDQVSELWLSQCNLVPEQSRVRVRSLKITNESSAERVQAALNALMPYVDHLGLSGQLDKLPEQLSIGQRQRALFLRSIAHQPRLLLIDEPTSALDPDNAQKLFDLIDDIARQAHISVLLITHDEEAVANYRRYVYAPNSSYADHSVFVSAFDNDAKDKDDSKDDMDLESDIQLMADMTIDYPAASVLSRSTNDNGFNKAPARNVVHKSKESGFHEIQPLVQTKAAPKSEVQSTIKPKIYEKMMSEHIAEHKQGHHMHYGYAHSAQNMRDYEHGYSDNDLVSMHLGGHRQINERVSYYSTPLDRLQVLARKYSNDSASKIFDNLEAPKVCFGLKRSAKPQSQPAAAATSAAATASTEAMASTEAAASVAANEAAVAAAAAGVDQGAGESHSHGNSLGMSDDNGQAKSESQAKSDGQGMALGNGQDPSQGRDA